MTLEKLAKPDDARALKIIAWLRRAPVVLVGGWRPERNDVVAALVIFAVCAACGATYQTTAGGGVGGYTYKYGPAVMLVCGKGYFEPYLSDCPALKRFMNHEVDTFSPSELPPTVRLFPPNGFQESWKYLMYTVALVWRVFGISWSSLALIGGAFFGATAVITYGLCRLAMRRPIAIVVVLLFASAPFHLAAVPGLRDYSKAPFLLLTMFLMACLVKRPLRRSVVWRLCVVAGITLGVGAGFRYDMMIGVPAFAIALLFFLPGGPHKNWPVKLAGLTLFLGAWYLCILPLKDTGGTENRSHVIILGLMTPFDSQLGIERSFYDFGYTFGADANSWSFAADHNRRVLKSEEPLRYVSKEHERVAGHYLLQLASCFPADVATRGFAAVRTSLDEIPFGAYDIRHLYDLVNSGTPYKTAEGFRDGQGHLLSERAVAPKFIRTEVLLKLYAMRNAVLGPLHGWGHWIVVAAVICLGCVRIRYELFAAFLTLYFCGSLCLQFDIRNAFHMQWITFWALGFLVQLALNAAFCGPDRARFRAMLLAPSAWPRQFWRPAVVALGITASLAAPFYALRFYQHFAVERLIAKYERSQLISFPIPDLVAANANAHEGMVGIRLGNFGRPDKLPLDVIPGLVHAEYLVVELGPSQTQSPQSVTFAAVFGSTGPVENNCSRQYTVRLPDAAQGGPTRVFIPVLFYDTTVAEQSSRFEHLEVSVTDLAYIRGFYRVADPSQVPFMLTLVLPPNWRDLPRCETIMTNPAHRRNWKLSRGGQPLLWPPE